MKEDADLLQSNSHFVIPFSAQLKQVQLFNFRVSFATVIRGNFVST